MHTRILPLLFSIYLVSDVEGLGIPKDLSSDVAIGSVVTIRHLNSGGYLHSNGILYPGGSKQQQISVHTQKDSSNEWQIFNATDDRWIDDKFDWENSPIEYVARSSYIKIRHLATQKHLHSHSVRPQISNFWSQDEVTGYGAPGFLGDENDNWILHIFEERLRSRRALFKLSHGRMGCFLSSRNVTLPEWGLGEQEVTCSRRGVQDTGLLWVIDTTSHPLLPSSEIVIEDNDKQAPQDDASSTFQELQEFIWKNIGPPV